MSNQLIANVKDSNPKDAVGIRKAPMSTLSVPVMLGTLAAILAGCEAMPQRSPTEPTAEPVTTVGEVGDGGAAAAGGLPGGQHQNRARVHTELAAAYYGRGNMAVALEELRIAVAADPNYALAYSMFGLVYMELREVKLAQTNFERALRLSPNDADINHNFGWFLCQTGRESEAIKHFLQAVRNPLYPMPWRSYSAAGICSLRKNNVKEAEEFFIDRPDTMIRRKGRSS